MHIGRVFRVINLLDVPEHKRKFWPQYSFVVVDPTNQSILDVMQYFTSSSDECNRDIRAYYPVCNAFCVTANQLDSVEKLQEKIECACKPVGRKAYIVGTAEKLRAELESKSCLCGQTVLKRS